MARLLLTNLEFCKKKCTFTKHYPPPITRKSSAANNDLLPIFSENITPLEDADLDKLPCEGKVTTAECLKVLEDFLKKIKKHLEQTVKKRKN